MSVLIFVSNQRYDPIFVIVCKSILLFCYYFWNITILYSLRRYHLNDFDRRSCLFSFLFYGTAAWPSFEINAFRSFLGLKIIWKKWKIEKFSSESCQVLISDNNFLSQVSRFSFFDCIIGGLITCLVKWPNFFAGCDNNGSMVRKIQERREKSWILEAKVFRCGTQLIDWLS